MTFLSFLFGCAPKQIYTYPVEMNPQAKISHPEDSTSSSDDQQDTLLPFPHTTPPVDVLQDNTSWFSELSLLNAITQSEQNTFQAQALSGNTHGIMCR